MGMVGRRFYTQYLWKGRDVSVSVRVNVRARVNVRVGGVVLMMRGGEERQRGRTRRTRTANDRYDKD